MLTIQDDLRRDSSSLEIVNIAVESTTRVKPVFASDASMNNRSIGNHSNNDLGTIKNNNSKNTQHYKTNRADGNGGHGEDLLSAVEQINNNE